MNERIRNWIVRKGPMLNAARMVDIYHLLSQVLVFDVAGDVVELGCHEGQCAILIREILNYHRSGKRFHVYDSFLGLPELHEKDAGSVFSPGELSASKLRLLGHFDELALEPPIVHQGWFADTLPDELPELICFAHIDADLYASILAALRAIYPRLARNAVVVIDDYDWEGLPGVNRAVDEFREEVSEPLCRMRLGPEFDATHGFFRRESGSVGGREGRPAK